MKYIRYLLILAFACAAFIFIDEVSAAPSLQLLKPDGSTSTCFFSKTPMYRDDYTTAYITCTAVDEFYLYQVDHEAPVIDCSNQTCSITTSLRMNRISGPKFVLTPSRTSSTIYDDYSYYSEWNSSGTTYHLATEVRSYYNTFPRGFATPLIKVRNAHLNKEFTISVSWQTTYGDNTAGVRDAYDSYQTQVKLDKIDGSIKDQTDTIKDPDTSGAGDTAGDFFGSFEDNDHGGLSGVVTAPLETVKSITSATCSPLTFPLPFVNKNMSLPCMSEVYGHFGPVLSIYQTITFGMIAYWVVVNILATIRKFKDPESDQIEVMSL